MIIGNAASERQENVVVSEGTNDQDFIVGTSNVSSIVNENALNVKKLWKGVLMKELIGK